MRWCGGLFDMLVLSKGIEMSMKGRMPSPLPSPESLNPDLPERRDTHGRTDRTKSFMIVAIGQKAPAQEAEELAVVLEEDPEHLGDRDDVLADGDSFEDFLLDALGKENDSLLVTRGAEKRRTLEGRHSDPNGLHCREAVDSGQTEEY